MNRSIVYIQEQYPNLTETFVRAEIEELCSRNYDVWVVTFKIVGDVLEDCKFKDRVVQVEYADDVLERSKNIMGACSRLKPCYFHTHFVTEAVKHTVNVSKAMNLPFGFTCHAYDIWLRGARVEPEYIAALTREELCITAAVEGSNHKRYLRWCGVPDDKLIITPNTVDSKKLPTGKREFGDSVKKIIAVGRPVAKKGFFVAIDAARLLRSRGYEVELEIVGGAESSSPLGALIESYALNFPFITCSGMQSNKEVLRKINDSDVLIMPSIVAENGDSDGIPTVLTEAMLMGVPVISTDVGSVVDLVISGKTGFIARQGDSASLAEKIVELDLLLKNKDEASAFIQYAKKHAGKRDIQASVNTLVAHLDKKLGSF